MVVELEKHSEQVQAAVFTEDDIHVVSIGTDKKIIVNEISEEEISSSNNNGFANNNNNGNGEGITKFKSKCIHKMETKHYYDIAMASNILVCNGKQSITVYNLPNDEHISDSLSDPSL